MAADIQFYLDENMQVAIADQLKRRDIEVITVRDLGIRGESDEAQLTRATPDEMKNNVEYL